MSESLLYILIFYFSLGELYECLGPYWYNKSFTGTSILSSKILKLYFPQSAEAEQLAMKEFAIWLIAEAAC